MKISNEIAYLLIAFPLVSLIIYSAIVIIGNHWILRAGGQTAHENYPKVIGHLRDVFSIALIGSLLFFLVIFNYVPSEVLVTLVSIGAGVFGTLLLKRKAD